ncbi:hypothetical protein R5M74_09925 [Aeromonas hydrophila]|nr:hypothetical protein R5M74_09925 [Aeromonas hydrophila]
MATEDGGGVVGAGDGDGDGVLGGAVSTVDHEGFARQGFAFFEGLYLRVVVVELIGPVAILVDGEGAMGAFTWVLGLEHGFAVVDIGATSCRWW